MKKKYYTLLIFILNITIAQNIIRGKIFDAETKEPLFGATIYIPELKTGTAADTNGFFTLTKIPQRSFLVEVKMIGYASKVFLASGKPNSKPVSIGLVPSATELQEIIVTGVASTTEQVKNPVPILIQPQEIFLQTVSTNLVDRLTKMPGINMISTGSAISKPVIRGLSYNRVVTLRDGMRQEGQQWGDEHGIEIDEYEVDHVEIIKGPGSIMYGSDAMAGVINNLTPNPVEEGAMLGEALASYQTNNNFLGTSLMQAGNIDGVNWLARISAKKVGNYNNAVDRIVLNSGFQEYNTNGYFGLNREWGFSHLQLSSFNQRLGVIEGDRDSLGRFLKPVAVNDALVEEISVDENNMLGFQNSIEIPSQNINHNRVAWINSIFFGESKLSINASWQQNRRREYADVLHPNNAELHFLLSTLNEEVKYSFPEYDGWNVSIGMSSQNQTNRNYGAEFLIPAYDMFDIGGFLFAQKDFNLLFLNGGIRYDYRTLNSFSLYLDANAEPTDAANAAETKFVAFKRNFSNISFSFGGSYTFSAEFIGRLNLSSGFRAPNISELGSNGKHEGTFRYEVGNSSLQPERSLQVDAGFSFTAEHVTFDVSGFTNTIAHYIFPEKLKNTAGGDSVVNPNDPVSVFKFVQGNANLYGGEISLDVHPHPYDWLHVKNSFSYVRGIQQNQPDSLSNLPFMPPPKLNSELRAQFTRYSGLQNLYFKIEGEYYFPQKNFYEAFGTETATSGYFLLGAGVGTEFVSGDNVVWCKVYLSADNLLDAKYQSHLSRLKYAPVNPATGLNGVYNQGRNFSIKIVVPVKF